MGVPRCHLSCGFGELEHLFPIYSLCGASVVCVEVWVRLCFFVCTFSSPCLVFCVASIGVVALVVVGVVVYISVDGGVAVILCCFILVFS